MTKSLGDKMFECGGAWKKQNQENGADYSTVNIRNFGFNANLRQAVGQGDESVLAVIACGPQSRQGFDA